jgi:hypothetical protein
MRYFFPAIVITGLALGAFGPGAIAQDVSAFEELQKTVRSGETLFVTDKSGKVTKGKVQELSRVSLRLKADGRTQRQRQV